MTFLIQRYHYQSKLRQVKKMIQQYQQLSDQELTQQTENFRQELQQGKTVRQLLVPAYATACVASERVLHKLPYDTQILGAIAMEYNNIAEMRTGEGKTLTAIMPMYLHGLTGPGNFLITANDYLANRDVAEMETVYRFLGLTVESGVAAEGENERQRDLAKIYAADIVYTTNSALGFDYLFDNLASSHK